jgi:exodeoxyribonuclease-3
MTALTASGLRMPSDIFIPTRRGHTHGGHICLNARANNAGWRIDYFMVSDRIKEKIEDVIIHSRLWAATIAPSS